MDLLEACQRGDSGAWARLSRERSGQIYRWAVVLGLRPADAEDAAQDVLVVAFRQIGRCAGAAALTSWLYQITRRVVANRRHLGWMKRVLLAGERPVEPAFAPRDEGPERELAVRACLRALRADQREVLLLCDVEGFTRDEAAEALGVPPGTVASRLRLAREAFRREWTRAPRARPEGQLSMEEP